MIISIQTERINVTCLFGTHTYDGSEHKYYVLSPPVVIEDDAKVIPVRHPAEDAYALYVNNQLVGIARPELNKQN